MDLYFAKVLRKGTKTESLIVFEHGKFAQPILVLNCVDVERLIEEWHK